MRHSTAKGYIKIHSTVTQVIYITNAVCVNHFLEKVIIARY